MIDDIKKLFPDDELWDAVDGMFRRIEIATEEVENAKNWANADKEKLHNAFMHLVPQHGMSSDKLYRTHCIEMLLRVHNDEDLAPATDSEICWIMYALGQHQPLTEDQAQLYMWMFYRIMSSEAKNLKIFPDYKPVLLYQELREQFKVEDRTPK